MAEPLAQIPTPEMPATGRLGFKEAMGIQDPFLKRKAELGTELGKAEADIAGAQRQQAETLAAGRAAAGERRAGAERMATERLETRMREEPLPAFVPTKDTTQDIASLFSLIGVIGMVVGGGGKKNALTAQAAMNGMLQGWQQGRQDLYVRQRNEFDKNFRSMVQKHNEFRKEMEDAVKLAQTDYNAGMQAAELAAAKAGSDIVKAQLRKGELLNAYKLVNESQTGVTKALEFDQKARDKEAADRQREADRAQREAAAQQRHQEFMLRMEQSDKRFLAAQAAREAKGAEKEAKPPAKEIIAQNQLRNTLIPRLETSLPVLDRLQKEGKWPRMTALLAVDPRAAEAAFRNDKEALNLILTLAYFRSKEFETAGKALTKKEDQILAPIVRGDLRTYEGIRNAMSEGLKTLKAEQRGLEKTYPYIKNLNEAMREEPETPAAAPAPAGGPYSDAEKERRYQEWKARQPK